MLSSFASPWWPLIAQTTQDGLELPPHVEVRPDLPTGPFTHLPDGRIAGRDGDRIRFSSDGGASWNDGVNCVGDDFDPAPEGAIACSTDGTLVFGFMDRAQGQLELGRDVTRLA